MSTTPEHVRPRFFTPGTWIVVAVAAVGAAALAWRFLFGLGAATNLSDAYPWGIWIALDVACGVALAAGGFTTAFLAHLLGRRQFHAIIRPALLTALIGYTFVALGVLTDLGRFWAIWHVLLPWMWQPNSVLLEVGLCVVTYLTVLYLEFVPIVCERFVGRVSLPRPLTWLNGPVDWTLRRIDSGLARIMTGLVILGVVLSCMHQSSLGTLMVIAGDKLHPLWQTPMLPLMFLVSAVAVGPAMVTLESLLASRSFRLPPEIGVLSRLIRLVPPLLGIYLMARVIDLVVRGAFGHVLTVSLASGAFLAEIGLGVIAPMLVFLHPDRRRSPRWLLAGSALVIFGVVANRLNVFLIGFAPRGGATYVPAWTEIAVTAGFVAMIVLAYRFVVLHFPVIEAMHRPDVRVAPDAEARRRVPPPTRLVVGRASRPIRPFLARSPRSVRTAKRGRFGRAVMLPALLLAALTTGPLYGDRSTVDHAPRVDTPVAGDAATGPDVVVLDALAHLFGPVRFDHRLHAGMSRLQRGCATCHHEQTSGPAMPCQACHAVHPESSTFARPTLKGAYHRQCLGCHRDWSGALACGSCHALASSGAAPTLAAHDPTDIVGASHPRAVARPTYVFETDDAAPGRFVTFHHVDHVERFDVSCASCHHETSCRGCHDRKAAPPPISRHERCFGCHAEPGCSFCHDRDPRPRFDHAQRTGWSLGAQHAAVACTDCHGPRGAFTRPASDGCRSCHAIRPEGFDHALTGVRLAGSHVYFTCDRCHDARDPSAPPSCRGCHPDRSYPAQWPGCEHPPLTAPDGARPTVASIDPADRTPNRPPDGS